MPDSHAPQYLWVYGTLRHGESNHHLLTGCSFMGMACYPGLLFSVQGHYPVFKPYNLSPQPPLRQRRGGANPESSSPLCLRRGARGEVVIGEIYQIQPELWPRLDELEGIEEGYYRRASFPVSPTIVPGEAQALVYVVGPLLESFCREEYRIASGDWCQSSFPL
jgi:gamma-glutamylcyclotransferase (GGCT)/AIG2-like uncharacterized protein YtfP